MSLPARLRAFGISKALDYLERDPDANLPKLMDWLDKYTGERLASPYRELFHRAMSDPGNNWHRLIKSMYTDIDSRVLKKIFENFVIHAGLMDWPSRNAAGELGNGRAPWAVIIDPSFPCEMGCRGCGASIYGVRPYMEFDSLDALRQLLVDHGWTWLTAVCTMLFSLMHWPCSTTCLTIGKETKSAKWTLLSIAIPTGTGMAVCFLVASAARLLGLA